MLIEVLSKFSYDTSGVQWVFYSQLCILAFKSPNKD